MEKNLPHTVILGSFQVLMVTILRETFLPASSTSVTSAMVALSEILILRRTASSTT